MLPNGPDDFVEEFDAPWIIEERQRLETLKRTLSINREASAFIFQNRAFVPEPKQSQVISDVYPLAYAIHTPPKELKVHIGGDDFHVYITNDQLILYKCLPLNSNAVTLRDTTPIRAAAVFNLSELDIDRASLEKNLTSASYDSGVLRLSLLRSVKE